MKKLLTSIIAGAALLFGFASCSGDLHDLTEINLSAGAVAGAMNGWDNTSTWTTVNGNVYTYDFVATDAEAEWKCIAVAGNWNSGAFGGGENAVIETPVGATTALEYDNATGGSKNAKITGLSAGSTYRITVTVDIIDATAKVECISSGSSLPTPYYFDGLYLVGSCFKIDTLENLWSFAKENLIHGASVDATTGIVTYKKDIVATAASGEMGINDSDWENKVAVKGTAVAADGEEYVVTGEGEKGNWNVTGLTIGTPYRVTITTTPDKDVSVMIEEICSYTLTFEITGLDEADLAWLNGSCWGSSWPCGWALAAWGGPGDGWAVSDAAVADTNGLATFGSKWNVTNVGKPGETLSFELKFVASDDAWATTKYDNPNISFDIEDLEAGTYKVSVDSQENEVTVTKL